MWVPVCWSALVCLICSVRSQSTSKGRRRPAKWSASLRIQITLFTVLRCLKHTSLSRMWWPFVHQELKLPLSGTRRPGASSLQHLLGSICIYSPCPSACNAELMQQLSQKFARTNVYKRCMHNKWNVTGIGKTATSVVPSEEPQVVNGKLLHKILTQQKEVTKHLVISWGSGFHPLWASIVQKNLASKNSGFKTHIPSFRIVSVDMKVNWVVFLKYILWDLKS